MNRSLKNAGLTGAGLAGGLAGWAAVNRAAVRRYQAQADPVDFDDLGLPADIRSHDIVMSDGWLVRVTERGPADGPAVVLLHGITLSATVWSHQYEKLPEWGLRVIGVDLRGHGRSLEPAEGKSSVERLTIGRLAKDVDEILGFFDLTEVILVGHSMGGMVALRLLSHDRPAREGRGRIAALALVATTANATKRRGLPGVSGLIALGSPILARGARLASHLPGPTLPAHDLAYLVARVTFGTESSPKQVNLTGQMASEVPIKVSGELILQILRFNEVAVLPAIRIPTTVVVGDHDLMTPSSQSDFLAARIAGAELVKLEGCGHMVMLERPRELNEAIVSLAERAAGTQSLPRAAGDH